MNPVDILCRNAVDVIDRTELESRLKEGRPLRVKAGFDPSAPDIHLGHTVLLRKLREFQDLGHKVVLLIGDFTATIGDPTGLTKTRPALTQKEVETNAKTYQSQAFKILDKDPKKIEVVHNSDWLGKMMLKDFLETLGTRFTVQQVLERNDFEKRMAENQPLSIREELYPLLQAQDSVAVKADVELGGTDQKFNLLAGRDLQRSLGLRPQIVMTFPLLVGLDGKQKMSKSLGNYIAVNDCPKDVFGKAMSIPDTLMASYYSLLTAEKYDPSSHPRDAKVKLAKLLVESLHGKKEADAQAEEFKTVFSNKMTPTKIDVIEVPKGKYWIVDFLRLYCGVQSGNEARRLIEQKAISFIGEAGAQAGYDSLEEGTHVQFTSKLVIFDGPVQGDASFEVPFTDGPIVRIGKKKYLKVIPS